MAGHGGVRRGEQLADAVRAEVEVTVVAVVPEEKRRNVRIIFDLTDSSDLL